jgi:signal transduction histidine kinase
MRNENSNNAAPQTALLITDDSDFRRNVVELWSIDGKPPLVVCVPSEQSPGGEVAWCDAVILGPVRPENLATALLATASGPPAVAFLPWGVSLPQVQAANPNILPLHSSDDAVELAVLIGNALLRRTAIERQLRQEQSEVRDSRRNAALGRFMIESRHSFNNALTTVLGTAELLLLLDASRLDDEQREQVRTVHAMAMRLYQMIVRFSALEAEMKLAESKVLSADMQNFLSAAPTTGARQ